MFVMFGCRDVCYDYDVSTRDPVPHDPKEGQAITTPGLQSSSDILASNSLGPPTLQYQTTETFGNGEGRTTMLRLILVSLAVACASAMVCLPHSCDTVECQEVTAENCVEGTIVKNGGWCGCCDRCQRQLKEGDNCFMNMILLGLPADVQCGPGLVCDSHTFTCKNLHDAVRASHVRTCAEHLQEVQHQPHLLGRFTPACEDDGSYSARQCHGSQCYCAAPTGEKILSYHSHIADSSDMDCHCARDQYAYMQTGLIGKLFYCTTSGNYRTHACMGSVCYCVDQQGNQKEGSPTVQISQLESLHC
ncbi:uncharacterized protein LOC143290288 [Babylonia areolata]|uniref:uncharacterized protein LOC143290288 n=1 Tax=Babylonia areolata TaxID=304850 RepID=UPI003FD5E131